MRALICGVYVALFVALIETMYITVCLLLFYAIATVFQLYHYGDMIYEIRRRKPDPTLLQTQGIFNLPLHIGMVWEELAYVDAVSNTQWGNGMQHS